MVRLELYNITSQENIQSVKCAFDSGLYCDSSCCRYSVCSRYRSVNYGCGSSKFLFHQKKVVDVIYGDYKIDVVDNLLCHNFSCERCRRIKKRMMFFKILELCCEHDLRFHRVLTCAGAEYRASHSIEESYVDMAVAWHKLSKMIDYWFVKKFGNSVRFSYIVMPRSQKDGYCHYHIISNFNLYKPWIQSVIKRYPVLGFVGVGKKQDPVSYLCNDFFKDSEYWIPVGKRHFSHSSDLDLSFAEFQDDWAKRFSVLFFRDFRKSGCENLDMLYEAVCRKYRANRVLDMRKHPDREYDSVDTDQDDFGVPLPLEEYVKVFYGSVVK